MAAEETYPIWSTIGKISAVIGLIIGLVTVYRFVRPPEPALSCNCALANVDITSMYSDLRTGIERRRTAATPSAIRETLKKTGQTHPSDGIRRFDAAEELSDAIFQDSGLSLITPLQRNTTIANCVVSNRGAKQATGVTLRTPFELAGAVVGDARPPRTSLSGKSVALGTIKPGETFRLYMWSAYPSGSAWRDDAFLLTFAEGAGEVSIALDAHGVSSTVATVVTLLTDVPLYTAFMVVLIILAMLSLFASLRRHYLAAGYNHGLKAHRDRQHVAHVADSSADDGGQTSS